MSSPYRHEWPPATAFSTQEHTNHLNLCCLKSKKSPFPPPFDFFSKSKKITMNLHHLKNFKKKNTSIHQQNGSELFTPTNFHSKISESVSSGHPKVTLTNQPTNQTNQPTKAPDERDQSGWTCRRRQTTRGPTCRWNDAGWADPVRSWEEISADRGFFGEGKSLGPTNLDLQRGAN